MSQQNEPLSPELAAIGRGMREGEALAASAAKMLKFVQVIVYVIVWSTSLSVEVVLHRKFGERYLSAAAWLLALGALSFGAQLDTTVSIWYVTMFVIASIVHRVLLELRNRRGEHWHSRNPGLSNLPFHLFEKNEWRVVQFWEPLMVAAVGGLMLVLGSAFGWFFVVAAVSLVVKTSIEYAQYRNKLLDAIDGQIESKHIGEALKGAPPSETKGYIVPGVGAWSEQDRVTVATAHEALGPELKELLEVKPESGVARDTLKA